MRGQDRRLRSNRMAGPDPEWTAAERHDEHEWSELQGGTRQHDEQEYATQNQTTGRDLAQHLQEYDAYFTQNHALYSAQFVQNAAL